MAADQEGYTYVAITNIPANFHAADLRAHFSALVETSSFLCFHFRHRPEKVSENVHAKSHTTGDRKLCCVAKVVASKLNDLLRHNKQNWTNANGDLLVDGCQVSQIQLTPVGGSEDAVNCVQEEKLFQMPELKPPDLMPQGNVGTPTLVFLNLIQQCRLPDNLIARLKLHFPKTTASRIYSNVNFDYGTSDLQEHSCNAEDNVKQRIYPSHNILVARFGAENNVASKLQGHMQHQSIAAATLTGCIQGSSNTEEMRGIEKDKSAEGGGMATDVGRVQTSKSDEITKDEDSVQRLSGVGVHNNPLDSVQSLSGEGLYNNPLDRIQGLSGEGVHNSPLNEVEKLSGEGVHIDSLGRVQRLRLEGRVIDLMSTDYEESSCVAIEDVTPPDLSVTRCITSHLEPSQTLTPGQSGDRSARHMTSSGAFLKPAAQTGNRSQKLTNRERKRLKKIEQRYTKQLKAENIEERLIAVEKRYQNDNDAEEWDRHEASEDDPSNQERNKERLYDEEIEQPWEKGGPGVVFYTDAVFWQEREGDFDEQTTDDLDVDFSVYEGEGSGDKDIQDFLKIRQEKRYRDGYSDTDRFSIGIGRRLPETSSSNSKARIGKFESHSKGIGRKVMESQGWREGQGLGRSMLGMVNALKGEGQVPRSKRGLGYTEAKPVMYGTSGFKKPRGQPHLITTIYDDPHTTDPKEPLLQRSEPRTLKHRQSHLDRFTSKPI